jgi:hypothetical protein
MKRARPLENRRSAQIHAENRARIAREREAMAARWLPATHNVVDPEQAFAVAFAAMGRDFGASVAGAKK